MKNKIENILFILGKNIVILIFLLDILNFKVAFGIVFISYFIAFLTKFSLSLIREEKKDSEFSFILLEFLSNFYIIILFIIINILDSSLNFL